jgi:hypothetical protein
MPLPFLKRGVFFCNSLLLLNVLTLMARAFWGLKYGLTRMNLANIMPLNPGHPITLE